MGTISSIIELELPSGSKVVVHRRRFGHEEGKRVVFVAGIRGDAPEGIRLAHSIAEFLEQHESSLNGIVDIYPCVNPLAAEQGVAIAQCNLGGLYERGQGVEEDHATALKWYESAGEENLTRAQYNAAVMYHVGRGTEMDIAKAMEWYERAANNGHVSAQYMLAVLYEHGEGMEKADEKKAQEEKEK